MKAFGRFLTGLSGAAFCCVGLFISAPASAFVACNGSDCWQTETKTKWPGEMIMYHDDSWWNEHKDDQLYRMHAADPQHDTKRGFWADGEWHTG